MSAASGPHTRRVDRCPALVAAGALLTLTVDSVSVNMALPRAATGLGVAQASLGAVTSAFALAYGGSLLVGGLLCDAHGGRRLMLGGATMLALSSVCAGVARDPTWLIAARALQGVAAAAMSPAAFALVVEAHPPGRRREWALGVCGAATAAGAPIGFIAGGLLTEWLGWSSIFFLNVPICTVLLIGSKTIAPRRPDAPDNAPARWRLAGASVVIALGIVSVSWPGPPVTSWRVVAGGLAVLASVVAARSRRRGERSAATSVPIGMRGALLAVVGLGQATVFIFGVFLTFALQDGAGLSPLAAGVAFLPCGAVAIGVAACSSNVARRVGSVAVLTAGASAMAAASLVLAGAGTDSYGRSVLPALVLFAAGVGAFGVATNIAAVATASGSQGGTRGAVATVAQQLGGAFGLTVAFALDGFLAASATSADAARIVFAFGGLCSLAAASVATVVLRRRAHRQDERSEDVALAVAGRHSRE